MVCKTCDEKWSRAKEYIPQCPLCRNPSKTIVNPRTYNEIVTMLSYLPNHVTQIQTTIPSHNHTHTPSDSYRYINSNVVRNETEKIEIAEMIANREQVKEIDDVSLDINEKEMLEFKTSDTPLCRITLLTKALMLPSRRFRLISFTERDVWDLERKMFGDLVRSNASSLKYLTVLSATNERTRFNVSDILKLSFPLLKELSLCVDYTGLQIKHLQSLQKIQFAKLNNNSLLSEIKKLPSLRSISLCACKNLDATSLWDILEALSVEKTIQLKIIKCKSLFQDVDTKEVFNTLARLAIPKVTLLFNDLSHIFEEWKLANPQNNDFIQYWNVRETP